MLIKPKSVVVAAVSSVVIALVLVLTLGSYLIYIEIKARNSRDSYREEFQAVNARNYSRYIAVEKSSASLERSGLLKGKPVIEGVVVNKGYRGISNMLVKAKFKDKEGAVLYEVFLRPQEPSLGQASATASKGPSPFHYFVPAERIFLKPAGSYAFKKVIPGCPGEILRSMRDAPKQAGNSRNAWDGLIEYEILQIEY